MKMKIRKSLPVAAAMAIAMMGIASSAVANGDRIVDFTAPNPVIPANRVLHLVGWAKFSNASGSMECDVTAQMKATGTTGKTGHVTNFTVPDTKKCKGMGFFTYLGCNELKTHKATTTNGLGVHDWHGTTTTNDIDVSKLAGTEMILHLVPTGTCLLNDSNTTLTFDQITLTPLNTTNKRVVTNTANNLGDDAGTGNAIAGFKISGEGDVHAGGVTANVVAAGELELSAADRCTWKFAA